MTDEKDRLGDKLRDAEKAREDQFFSQRDRELLGKLKAGKAGQGEGDLRQAALMRCPKCGERLAAKTLHEVAVKECPGCHGIWLDQGAMERIEQSERGGWVSRWLRQITGA